MAVLDIPAMMEMFRQDELQKVAMAEAQRKQAVADQPDVDFTFEKGGLKVKGKLKDLPTLSQDPNFAPYLSGIGATISNEQNLDNEEIDAQRVELTDRLKDLQKKKIKQEIEVAKGDTYTAAFELGRGLIGAKPRADVMKDIEAEAGVYRKKLAELGFNRQTGQTETRMVDEDIAPLTLETPAVTPAPAATQAPLSTPAPVGQVTETQPATRSFKSAQEARAAGVKDGELIYINGRPGRLQPRQ